MHSVKRLLLVFAIMLGISSHVDDANAVDPDDARLYLVSLYTLTCDRSNAGTDDEVYVNLDTYSRFYLDNPGDDRERGQWDEYRLTISTLDILDDIRRLQFNLVGNDGWCVDDVILLVNGTLVFSKLEIGRWLDGDNSAYTDWYRIERSELRSHILWPDSSAGETVCQVPTKIEDHIVRQTLDGLVGNELAITSFPDPIAYVKWNGSTSLTRKSSTRWNYRLRLRAVNENSDIFISPDVDIVADYNVTISCSGGLSLAASLSSLDVSTTNWFANTFFKNKIKEMVEDALAPIEIGLNATGAVTSCSLDSGGNLLLGWPANLPDDPLCL